MHRDGEVLSEDARGGRHPADRAGGRRPGRGARGVRRPGRLSPAWPAASGHGRSRGRYGERRDERRDQGRRPCRGRARAVVSAGRPPWWLMAAGRWSCARRSPSTCWPAARSSGSTCGSRTSSSGWGLADSRRLSGASGWSPSSAGGSRSSSSWPRWSATSPGAGAPGCRWSGCCSRSACSPSPSTRSSTAIGPHGARPTRAPSSSTRDGASFPSGHVANAVLMWGIARWQAVEYGLPAAGAAAVLGAQRRRPGRRRGWRWCRWTSTGSPTPWSAQPSASSLLGVVHALDAVVLSRWVRARAGRQTA